jgi:type VI secretion system VasD/TssJ family lipoprotein
MTYRKWALLALAALMFTACASAPLPPPNWTYEKNAIEIQLKADPKLNFDDGVPHTLVLCLYQLRDPNTFNQLSDDTDGIYKLLECELFDGSVATSKRLIVHPGQDMKVMLDRADGAKYVAVAAGYYVLQKERMIRLFDIPVVIESKGLIKRTKQSKPGRLTIDLELGPSQIKKK